eukprot:jgi/Galph1/3868/GphlegSOOS_G2526.1
MGRNISMERCLLCFLQLPSFCLANHYRKKKTLFQSHCPIHVYRLLVGCQQKSLEAQVVFVGAGPGDKDLLTLGAVRELRNAQVVLYDHLVNQDLLQFCSNTCEKIYVGKDANSLSSEAQQKQIHQLMEQYYRQGKYVIRLKGGDAGVFGRLAEEVDFIRKINANYKLIPGVSSVLAAPLLAGIPLTHKMWSKEVMICSGHDIATLNWEVLSIVDTVVMVMATKNLHILATKLIEAGKMSSVPVAVIYQASTERQQVILGTLEEWARQVKQILSQPAIIVIGKVAEYAL